MSIFVSLNLLQNGDIHSICPLAAGAAEYFWKCSARGGGGGNFWSADGTGPLGGGPQNLGGRAEDEFCKNGIEKFLKIE